MPLTAEFAVELEARLEAIEIMLVELLADHPMVETGLVTYVRDVAAMIAERDAAYPEPPANIEGWALSHRALPHLENYAAAAEWIAEARRRGRAAT
ncbi:hypothetical protein [Phenylobacterium sp.]|uniref:hypothetical protein n=1 Tax=Phenylobacterium sp. TaxID=1871053 RepID=UPI00273642C6|nr:hypothetical protein [Phenylobacterium sp.]MDP3853641.1 hypothetical protein [Phenylobacterium sp.]